MWKPNALSFLPSTSEEAQKPNPVKRKFQPHKITFSNNFEDDTPMCKKSKKQINDTSLLNIQKKVLKPIRMTITAEDLEDTVPVSNSKRKPAGAKGSHCTSNVAKKIFKPMRMTITAEDWEDTLPVSNCKRKPAAAKGYNVARKSVVPAKASAKVNIRRASGNCLPVFVKPKQKKPVKTIRKELFSGPRSPMQQISEAVITEPYRMNRVKSFIPVNDIEGELLRCSQVFQQLTTSRINNTSESVQTTKAELDFKNTAETSKKAYKFCAASTADTASNNLLSTHHYSVTNTESEARPFNISNVSPEENEFVENERKCKSSNDESSLDKEITAILHNDEEYVVKLHQKFKSMQQQFKNLKEEMECFQKDIECYEKGRARDMKKVIEIMNGAKENVMMNQNLHIMSTVKKTVTFNDQPEDRIVDDFPLQDIGLEKSVHLYNSLRKGCKSVLGTPKHNRTCLQTPKRACTDQKESISRKVQKQCLLLLDTPLNKKKNNSS